MTEEMQNLAQQILDNGRVGGEKFVAQSRALALLVLTQRRVVTLDHLLAILPVGVDIIVLFEELLDTYLAKFEVRETRRQKVKEGVCALLRQAQEEND